MRKHKVTFINCYETLESLKLYRKPFLNAHVTAVFHCCGERHNLLQEHISAMIYLQHRVQCLTSSKSFARFEGRINEHRPSYFWELVRFAVV